MRTNVPAINSGAYRGGAFALLIAAGTLLTAVGFQYLGGYQPCPLCLQQRYAYYFAIPALFIALVLYASGRYQSAAFIFLLTSIAFLANAVLGSYHAGAEWKFWPGPETCAGAFAAKVNAVDLLKQLETVRVIRCDEAPWRMFGLSFAGWNVIISTLQWITSLQAAYAASADSHLAKGEKIAQL